MVGWRNPKAPLNIPKAVRLRDRAAAIKGRADALLREADALLAEADTLEESERLKSLQLGHKPTGKATKQADEEFRSRISPKGSIATRKLYS